VEELLAVSLARYGQAVGFPAAAALSLAMAVFPEAYSLVQMEKTPSPRQEGLARTWLAQSCREV
jgi:hypothetical protein